MSAISWPQSPNCKASTLDTRWHRETSITQIGDRVYFTLIRCCCSPFWCVPAALSAGLWLAPRPRWLVLGAQRGPAVGRNILRGVMWAGTAVGLFPASTHLPRTPLGQHCGGQTWLSQSCITQRDGFMITSHILLCQKGDYRHKQAWPTQWVQREQLQPDNGSHGDGRPAVQQEEEQHWLLPLLLSEFSPGRNRCLLGSKGTWIAIEIMATDLNESVKVHTCIWVSTSLWLLPAPAYLDCIQTLAFQTCGQFLSPYLE